MVADSRILITGASGSGTTTLGQYLEAHHGFSAIDTDDYYWEPTQPPYQIKQSPEIRLEKILSAVELQPMCLVTGSIINWGGELEDGFDLIVFLYLETTIRVERLRARELQELGEVDEAFLDWASEYDTGPASGRSLARHEQWLSERTTPVLSLEGDLSVAERAQSVLIAVGAGAS